MGSSTLLVPVREVANNAVHVLRGRHEVHRLELWLGVAVSRDGLDHCRENACPRSRGQASQCVDKSTVRASEELQEEQDATESIYAAMFSHPTRARGRAAGDARVTFSSKISNCLRTELMRRCECSSTTRIFHRPGGCTERIASRNSADHELYAESARTSTTH